RGRMRRAHPLTGPGIDRVPRRLRTGGARELHRTRPLHRTAAKSGGAAVGDDFAGGGGRERRAPRMIRRSAASRPRAQGGPGRHRTMQGTILSAPHSTRMRTLYSGIGALAGALVLLTIWLGQHERNASIDRLEQWEPRSPSER